MHSWCVWIKQQRSWFHDMFTKETVQKKKRTSPVDYWYVLDLLLYNSRSIEPQWYHQLLHQLQPSIIPGLIASGRKFPLKQGTTRIEFHLYTMLSQCRPSSTILFQTSPGNNLELSCFPERPKSHAPHFENPWVERTLFYCLCGKIPLTTTDKTWDVMMPVVIIVCKPWPRIHFLHNDWLPGLPIKAIIKPLWVTKAEPRTPLVWR